MNNNRFYFMFKKCKDLAEVKSLYRSLAKTYHPDLGGDVEQMKLVNAAYDYICKQFINNDKKYDTNEKRQKAENEAYSYKDIIAQIIHIQNITIEIVGSWVWVYGDTKPHKELFNRLGFDWCPGKKKWALIPADQKNNKKRKSYGYSYDKITSKYGKTTIKDGYKKRKKKDDED